MAHVERLRANPLFPRLYSNVDFKMIELGRLIAFQHWMDTDVSDENHGAGIEGMRPTRQQVLDKCLPARNHPDGEDGVDPDAFPRRSASTR